MYVRYLRCNSDFIKKKDKYMKTRTQKLIHAAFCACGASLVFAIHSAAYIDPATTSYVIQIVVGVVIACGTAAGIIFNKMRRKFKKKDNADTQAADTPAEGTSRGGVMTAADLLGDDSPENATDSSTDENAGSGKDAD